MDNPHILAGDPNRRSCPRSFAQAVARGLVDIAPQEPTFVTPSGFSSPDAILVSGSVRPAILSPTVYSDTLNLSDAHIPFGVDITCRAIRMHNSTFSLRQLMLTTRQTEQVARNVNQEARGLQCAHKIVSLLTDATHKSQLANIHRPTPKSHYG